MHDTDTAGVIFFANQFRIIHEAYEEWLDKVGFGFGKIFNKGKYFIPIVHAESDYKCPLIIGDTIKITLHVTNIGKSSFTISYAIERCDMFHKTLAGTAQTVHVIIDSQTERKIKLPKNIRKALEQNYVEPVADEK